MTLHLARSRVTKALTDAQIVSSFAAAEERLAAISPGIALGGDQLTTAAGQAAALTALATAIKCFEHATLICSEPDTPLTCPLPLGSTVGTAAAAMGATISATVDPSITHLVRIGWDGGWDGWQVWTWWDKWLSGVRTGPGDGPAHSGLALAGIFSAALAVRQIFANVLRAEKPRSVSISLWEPQKGDQFEDNGPDTFTIPTHLWFVGLGHLGQAFVWALSWLPFTADRYAILQDDQTIAVENEATSILVLPKDIGVRKTRVAGAWLEHAGWQTELIERRHAGDIRNMPHDPAVLLAGLDDVKPRRILAACGFDFMIDAGIGSGAQDFEGIQLRVIAAGTDIEAYWSDPPPHGRREKLQTQNAYKNLASKIGECGTVPIADASVAVPFVGAATAALGIAQLARLGEMQPACAIMQMELGSPAMVIDGGHCPAPQSFLGGETFFLKDKFA